MAPKSALVVRPQQDRAREFSLNPEVEVLAGRVAHMLIHGAKTGTFSGASGACSVWNLSAGTIRVVGNANRRRTGVVDLIRACGVKVDQGIERWVPRPIRPDVVEDAVVGDSVAATNRHFVVAHRVKGKTNARRVVMVLGGPHFAYGTDPQSGEAARLKVITTEEVGELREDVVGFSRSAVTIPADAQIQGESRCQLPIVLRKPVPVVVGEVTIGVSVCASRRVD